VPNTRPVAPIENSYAIVGRRDGVQPEAADLHPTNAARNPGPFYNAGRTDR
jgi:hypothetical protein